MHEISTQVFLVSTVLVWALTILFFLYNTNQLTHYRDDIFCMKYKTNISDLLEELSKLEKDRIQQIVAINLKRRRVVSALKSTCRSEIQKFLPEMSAVINNLFRITMKQLEKLNKM